MKLNPNLLKATIVGALGGLLFGFDTAVISGTTHALTIVYGLTPRTLGLTVSIALWGTVIGAMSAGVVGQRFGGRETLRLLAALYVISALGCAFAISWPVLVVARFIGGLGIGGSSVLGPMYIAEIAPAKWRGRLVGLFQLNIVAGILLAYLSNYGIARIVSGAGRLALDVWRRRRACGAVFNPVVWHSSQPALAGEEPRGGSARCASIRSAGDRRGRTAGDRGLDTSRARARLREPLFSARNSGCPSFWRSRSACFNQFSGINAILYYLNDIFAPPDSAKSRAICKPWRSASPT